MSAKGRKSRGPDECIYDVGMCHPAGGQSTSRDGSTWFHRLKYNVNIDIRGIEEKTVKT